MKLEKITKVIFLISPLIFLASCSSIKDEWNDVMENDTYHSTAGAFIVAVVDDSKTSRFATAARIPTSDTIVYEYPSAESFLADFKKGKRFDLVVCDHQMAPLDGVFVLSEIRERSPKHIPFILTSAFGTEEELNRIQGADAVLEKRELDKLPGLVREFLKK